MAAAELGHEFHDESIQLINVYHGGGCTRSDPQMCAGFPVGENAANEGVKRVHWRGAGASKQHHKVQSAVTRTAYMLGLHIAMFIYLLPAQAGIIKFFSCPQQLAWPCMRNGMVCVGVWEYIMGPGLRGLRSKNVSVKLQKP